MKFRLVMSAVLAFVLLALGGTGCTAAPAEDLDTPSVDGAEDGLWEGDDDREEEVASTSDELRINCDNTCTAGGIVGCSKFGGLGAVACGFSSWYMCTQVCKKRHPRYCGYAPGRRCGAHATWWDTNSRCLRWRC